MRNPFKKKSSLGVDAYTDLFRSVRTRQRKRVKHRWRWALLALVLLLAGVGGFGVWKYYATQDAFQDENIDVTEVPEGEPFIALLVGSDSRAGLTPEEQFDLGAGPSEGENADTLILAQVDPKTNEVRMVQFPRDLYVPLADGEKAKINAALEEGRPFLVETIEALTGLAINKYVQLNIAGFRDVVDAIGGVDVCIPEPIPFDPKTGIKVTEEQVGMVHFGGDRALRYVRSRQGEGGDFDRIANQQKFLAAAIAKITSVGTLLRPDRLLELADIAGRNLRTDQHMDIPALNRLLKRFRSFDPERYEAYTVPNFGAAEITLTSGDPLSIVKADQRAMDLLFDAIANNRSPQAFDGVPDIDPATIKVGVYNGTLEDGAAARAGKKLQAATAPPLDPGGGVRIFERANAASFDVERTMIRYRAEARAEAELISAVLPSAEFKEGKTRRGVDVAVVVGADRFRTKRLVQLRPLEIPEPSDPPAVCRT
ncbi:MAG: LCP family protein [Actinomycetota bacterium]|nr:LCP family protein [Actinomycetota bacterium]